MKRKFVLVLALALIFCLGSCVLLGCSGDNNADAAIEAATAKLNEKIATLYEEIAKVNGKIADLEAEKATLIVDKAALETQLAEKENQIRALENRIADLTALLEGEDAELAEKLNQLEAEKSALTAEKSALTAELAEKNATISAITAELEGVKTENAALKAEIERLKADGDSALKSEIAALKNCVKGNHTLSVARDNGDGTHTLTCTVCETAVKESHTFSSNACTACGAMQKGYGEYEYLYFGEYPQSVKSDDVTITETQDARGYYLGSDGSYYAKVTALPNGMITFNNGKSISNNTVYYFKVEPIRWRILSDANGEKMLLCDSIIETMAYQSSYYMIGGIYYTGANGAPDGRFANNYEYSSIRAWLNGDFYANYFTAEERARILTTSLDNSASSTGYKNNPYVGADTEDNIFLLSYADVTNSYYGFASSNERCMNTSDYLRAKGVSISTSQSTYGNGHWWLRSPGNGISIDARGVNYDGYVSNFSVLLGYGVVPALRIRQ